MACLVTTTTLAISPQARTSYLALSAIARRTFHSSPPHHSSDGKYHRSSFHCNGQGFTNTYEPGQPTKGPLAKARNAPRITPTVLKDHLDQFVVGQDRAKKVLSVAVYNHYMRVQELQRLEDEHAEQEAQRQRRERGQRSAVEDYDIYNPPPPPEPSEPPLLRDESPLQIEKSNVMLLGPSGVGKTLIARTLARVLDVPFSMSDCTAFTQAGYIGEDAEVCVRRLLEAAKYDVAAAENGIIYLDEIDKIATAKVSHGKDVGGEGVQQALLKIIEGTTLQFQAKPDRGGNGRPGNQSGNASSFDRQGGQGSGVGPPNPQPGKGEVYNVRTDNILFVCAGAFGGLHKMILDRISKGSMGFGAPVRASNPESGTHETMFKGEDELFRKHVPYFTEPPDPNTISQDPKPKPLYNILDLVQPSDLQKYGMIPELVGRIPISCALAALDEDDLVRVLTEPRNSLIAQYEWQLGQSDIELRFTTAALREVAKSTLGMGTGARGLRTVLERLLGDSMFYGPGSNTKHILVTQAAAQLKCRPLCFARGQSHSFEAAVAEEEENATTFEEWRNGSAGVAGVGVS